MAHFMTQPITPAQVGATKADILPPEVFQAFNRLIAAHSVNGSATIRQDDVISLIVELMIPAHPMETHYQRTTDHRFKIVNSGWLNVEDAYRAAGWCVVYDKAGFNESYPSTFTFSTP